MEKIFSFDPAYPQAKGDGKYFFANLDMGKPLNIQGYDVLLRADSYWGQDSQEEPVTYDFVEARGAKYKLQVERGVATGGSCICSGRRG